RQTDATIAEAPDGRAGATIWFEARRGEDDRAIQEAAIVHDAILFVRDEAETDAGLDSSETVKTALQSAGRPLLIVPEQASERFPSTVAIAWNGSIEGA